MKEAVKIYQMRKRKESNNKILRRSKLNKENTE